MWTPQKGITQSLISKFLQCPYAFYWYAIKGLEENGDPPYPLVWGDILHVGLEHYLQEQTLDNALVKMEERYHHHGLRDEMLLHSTRRMLPVYRLPPYPVETEVEFSRSVTLPSGRTITVRGKADGVYKDTLFEHKCKKRIEPTQTLREIPLDLQVNLYCWILDLTRVQYDLILIPDEQFRKPHRLVNESAEAYCTRIYRHHSADMFPISSKPSLWIHQLQVDLDPEMIQKVIDETFIPICERMCDWYENVTSPNFNIEDPTTWGREMYRSPIRHFDPGRTDLFKGNYWHFLTGEIDEEDLVPTKLFSELKE